ncbi:MAG: recombinase family protein [Oscillospiraceae bacterium]|nr:recombinase family protein [Oscillospiraceae bacterium]
MTLYAYSYLRLSEEEYKTSESGSIKNQRLTIQQYCEKYGIVLLQEFVDDGWSGGNFKRPGFTAMIQSLDGCAVNLIITKDLSRLGRDMQESSYYAEKFFPDHGIRYIAIYDNFDSEKDNALAPFQFAMNDVYIREVSRKIKTVMRAKKSAGEYAACPPYGYRRDPENRHCLVPDEQTAHVVTLIFSLAAKGESTRSITEFLTRQRIIPPLKYRALYRDNFGPDSAARASDLWNYTTVKRIIRNEVYLGKTLLGKTKKVSLKSKQKKALARNEWFITDGTHTPLVDQVTWELAQRNLAGRSTVSSGYDAVRRSIFGGLVFCANCGAAMCSAGGVYKGEREKYWYLQCNNLPKRSAHPCDHPARIKYDDLRQIVTDDLNSLIDLSDAEIDAIVERLQTESYGIEFSAQVTAQIKSHEASIQNSDKMITKLYQDNLAGILSDDRLARMVQNLETDSSQHAEAAAHLHAVLEDRQSRHQDRCKFCSLVKSASHIDELTPATLAALIDRIEISERILPEGKTVAGPKTPYKQDIKIFYRFIGNTGSDSLKSVDRA